MNALHIFSALDNKSTFTGKISSHFVKLLHYYLIIDSKVRGVPENCSCFFFALSYQNWYIKTLEAVFEHVFWGNTLGYAFTRKCGNCQTFTAKNGANYFWRSRIDVFVNLPMNNLNPSINPYYINMKGENSNLTKMLFITLYLEEKM